MALPEEILVVLAKNQFNKDPYISDMLAGCLRSVMAYYHAKNDHLLDETLEVLGNNIHHNGLFEVLQHEKLTVDIINQLEPKELLKAQIMVTGQGKIAENEEEKERLRELYKAIIEKRG